MSQLKFTTASFGRSYASEAEIRYQKIVNALDRMAKREALREKVDLDDWGKDAELYLNSFQGIKSILWVDKSFLIQRVVPQGDNTLLYKTASDLISDPSEVNLWVSIIRGSELIGFILGIIDVEAFISPVIVDIKNDFMLQISDEGSIVFISDNWKDPDENYRVDRLIVLQNAGTWNFSLAPTNASITSEIADAGKTLVYSLLFSLITLAAVYFAQNYNTISKLSELRFRKTLEGMMEGCQIIGMDWRYLFVNDTAAAQFQLSKAAMLGHPLTECYPGIEKTDLYHLLQRCMQERIPQAMLHSLTLPNGAQVWYQLSIIPAPDGIFILSIDVTERKRAEESLRQSQILLNETQRISKMGGWELNPLTNKVTWTDEVYQIYGLSKEYDPGNANQDIQFYQPEDRSVISEALHQAVEKGQPYDLELQLINAQGIKLWVRTIGQVEILEGKTIRVFGNIMDITERKQAEWELYQLNAELEQRVAERTSQLQASNKELEASAYSVSHDLRAPLRAIDGFSHILQEEYAHKMDEEGQGLLGIILKNTNKMDQLITDLLALSRVSRTEISYSPIDMTALVNATYQELATPEVLKKFAFSVSNLPDACGDPTLIRQVWTNLISNAIKYTLPKENCCIEISGSVSNGSSTYVIMDNGVGYNPDYAEKLFGVFQRLHKANDFEGTGVGLAIVQRIIHRHGGQVWGEGQVDAGATFSFTLPDKQKYPS